MSRSFLTALLSTVASTGVCVSAGALSGCGVDSDWSDPYDEGPYPPGEDGGILGDGAASTDPILAKIDPNATLVQEPGDGVGVFTQYVPTSTGDPGGHWYIWWTCDTLTNPSSSACNFDIRVTVANGLITNAKSQAFADTDQLTGGGTAFADGGSSTDSGDAGANGGGASSTGTNSITAQTLTTTSVQGVTFDTDPGAVITLSAALGGEYSGSFLFFVQNGLTNGGFTGTLTDPLDLQSSSP